MSHTLGTFVWFLWQASIVGGLGAAFFWIPFLALAVATSWAFARAVINRRKLWLLVSLPVIWIAVGLWGAAFWVVSVPNPEWVMYPVNAALPVYCVVTLILVAFLRDARLFASLVAIANLYFAVAMTFLATMAVTGTWL